MKICRQMVIHVQARVTAREIQANAADEHCITFSGYELYCHSDFINFEDWEGTVVTYDANGNIVTEWTNLSAWRNAHAVVHGPRRGPRR